jgi:hypothetical protein
MKFSTKITWFAAIPALLYVVALITSIGSLTQTQRGFDRYINNEQAIERGLTEMYAQGLQMGQAIRNILLDPKNPKAYDNLKAAEADYGKAFVKLQEAAKGSSMEATLGQLVTLRETQAKAQQKVLAQVAANADATEIINKEETPAWRALKAELLKQSEIAKKLATTTHDSVDNSTTTAITLSIVLAAIAVLAALILNYRMLSTVNRELGGDPADARRALAAIAQGDLDCEIRNSGSTDSLMGVMQQMDSSLKSIVSRVRDSAAGIAIASAEIAQGNHDLSARTEQQGQCTGRNRRLHGRTQRHRQTKRRQRPPGQPARHECQHRGRAKAAKSSAQVVETMKGINDSSRKISRHHQRHRRYRLPDQHPGFERSGRGRPCRRTGPWLCRRRLRSALPGRSQR